MLDKIIFLVNFGILILLAFSIMLMFLSRKFESKEFQNVADMLTASLFVFGFVVLIDLIFNAGRLGYMPGVLGSFDLTIFITGIYLVLIPLTAVLFFGAAISLKE